MTIPSTSRLRLDPDNAESARVTKRLGMRYRGMEAWHGQTVAVHDIGAAAWRARSA